MLCRNGKALDLSLDHKASRHDEQERIKKQGGYIVFGRVLGRLAVTRAFGDFDCKNIEVQIDDHEKEIKNFVLISPEVSKTRSNSFPIDSCHYNRSITGPLCPTSLRWPLRSVLEPGLCKYS